MPIHDESMAPGLASSTAPDAQPVGRGKIGVVAVLTDAAGRYLMIRRAESVSFAGWWCFPGGAIEPDETQEQAVVREMGEEVGLEVDPLERLWTWRRADGCLTLHWWRVSFLAGELQPRAAEVAEARWMLPDEIRSQDLIFPNNLEFLDRIGA